MTYNLGTEILVTVGGTQAICLALMALTNPGDEVLVPDPASCATNSHLNTEVVMSHVTDRSRIMIVKFPNNPTGAVFSYDDDGFLG